MPQWSDDLIPVDATRTLDGLFVQRVRRSPDRLAYRSFDQVKGRPAMVRRLFDFQATPRSAVLP